jgi:hypothetical protein
MPGYDHVTRITVPLSCVEAVYKHLRSAGEQEVEGVALLAGQISANDFSVLSTIIPKQDAYKLEGGLLYSVEGDELHRINVWLYQNRQTLIAQIHSHPGHAYHSETDDAYPIITVLGGVSIVIPYFAAYPFELEDWAVYRLSLDKEWVELSLTEVENLIHFV